MIAKYNPQEIEEKWQQSDIIPPLCLLSVSGDKVGAIYLKAPQGKRRKALTAYQFVTTIQIVNESSGRKEDIKYA